MKSSCCDGFGHVGVLRGGRISPQLEYRCDQKSVPQARLSSAIVPCLRFSHSRNAWADTSQ